MSEHKTCLIYKEHPLAGRFYFYYVDESSCNGPDYYGVTESLDYATRFPRSWWDECTAKRGKPDGHLYRAYLDCVKPPQIFAANDNLLGFSADQGNEALIDQWWCSAKWQIDDEATGGKTPSGVVWNLPDKHTGNYLVLLGNGKNRIIVSELDDATAIANYALSVDGGYRDSEISPAPAGEAVTHESFEEWL